MQSMWSVYQQHISSLVCPGKWTINAIHTIFCAKHVKCIINNTYHLFLCLNLCDITKMYFKQISSIDYDVFYNSFECLYKKTNFPNYTKNSTANLVSLIIAFWKLQSNRLFSVAVIVRQTETWKTFRTSKASAEVSEIITKTFPFFFLRVTYLSQFRLMLICEVEI